MRKYIKTYEKYDNANSDLKKWKRAIKTGNIKTLKKMLEQGFDINKKFIILIFKNVTSLSYALYYNQYDVVKFLIDNDCELDIFDVFDPSNETYFISSLITHYYLERYGNQSDDTKKKLLSIIKSMIKKGADINLKSDDTALTLAAIYELYDIIYILIDAGADWNIKNTDDKDFYEILKDDYKKIIRNRYPEKYEKYLTMKKANEFNL